VLAQRIVGTDVELCACLVDWQKAFGSLNGPDWYRSERKLVVTGVTENRVSICVWNGILNYDWSNGRQYLCRLEGEQIQTLCVSDCVPHVQRIAY